MLKSFSVCGSSLLIVGHNNLLFWTKIILAIRFGLLEIWFSESQIILNKTNPVFQDPHKYRATSEDEADGKGSDGKAGMGDKK